MIKKCLIPLLLTLTSSFVSAAPELISPVEIKFGHFIHVDTIEITGNINASLLRLVDDSLKSNDSDYYVIGDISENTDQNTMTISVDLYDSNEEASSLASVQ
ncbi:hypothetical protein [Photobacterium jeanii]|uniref:hypothetical protein n=1 Tax=Photobacterium jeanii TaxID=858640 RepID=UPI00082CBFA4|nr:hypothetical protein [Photobacterium jeanii]